MSNRILSVDQDHSFCMGTDLVFNDGTHIAVENDQKLHSLGRGDSHLGDSMHRSVEKGRISANH